MDSTTAEASRASIAAPLHLAPAVATEECKILALDLPSLTLSRRNVCDIELIMNGGFAPLKGFMNKADFESVLHSMRLTDGTLWPMPVTLDVDEKFAKDIMPGQKIALRDTEGLLLAILEVSDVWKADKKSEALAVFKTLDDSHAGVAHLLQKTKDYYVGGGLIPVALPNHYDFKHLRQTPAELREIFRQRGWNKIVAFQTRNPMHRAHQELTMRAMQHTGAKLLLHPVAGETKPGDIDYYLRVRCYEHVLPAYPAHSVHLSLLPLAMRMAGPREALWHAIIRKNYGCTHFIVGRDHAGPGKNRNGQDFYSPYDAQTLVLQHQADIGIEIVPFHEMAYSKKESRYFPVNEFPKNDTPSTISGTELRERLQKNQDIPGWFSFPEVINELRKVYPLKHRQGFTVFFTGLPSSGKSTLANGLMLKLREMTGRQVSLLDGDEIRTHLSQGLGFDKKDREINVARVGYVAREITRHGGIAICALVAPFMESRNLVRGMIGEVGGFIEVYVSTSVEVCQTRDRKGMYKLARAGRIKQFTGISDPYEPPVSPEITIDTSRGGTEEMVDALLEKIRMLGYIA
ncbi:putative bifunctional SAT/APS kinase [Aquicella siphonis]|uniref:Adenylyl-sulfate kinase n=1 Tax=Aquicella siphonis TaxID=254247 RepID=A0A5E4PJ72_9COXI|nr:bifunctional sulfate adenylyltransferase/adenylylsulfate kinase [Aquicella siphonis]VVC76625.1 putative bifunctional SAT/APS kinase [Aquicella siphonis]